MSKVDVSAQTINLYFLCVYGGIDVDVCGMHACAMALCFLCVYGGIDVDVCGMHACAMAYFDLAVYIFIFVS